MPRLWPTPATRRGVQEWRVACRNGECRTDIRAVKSPLGGLRFHDLRHHAITELSEGQASDPTIMSIAGHISPKMLRHYSHVRLDAKRKALSGLSGGGSGASYDTNNDTNSSADSKGDPQLAEKPGGADGIRTHDLLDAIEARSQLRHGPTVNRFLVYHMLSYTLGDPCPVIGCE